MPDAAVVPIAAGSAGLVLSFVLSPFELVKCRMQLGARGGHNYRSDPTTFKALKYLKPWDHQSWPPLRLLRCSHALLIFDLIQVPQCPGLTNPVCLHVPSRASDLSCG